MKVKLSSNLERHMPLMKTLVNRLDQEFDYVSILGTDVSSRINSVNRSGKSIQDSNWFGECGYVVRVHNGVNYSEHSFNELSEKSIDDIYEDILAVGKSKFQKLRDRGMSIICYDKIEEETIKEAFASDVEMQFDQMTSEEKLKMLEEIHLEGMKQSEALVDVRVVYNEVHTSKVFISSSKELSQAYCYSTGVISTIARKEDKTQYTYRTVSGLKGPELMRDIRELIPTVVEEVLQLLDAERIEPGEYDIICAPTVTGVIAHEAFGHGVETDMFVKDRAKAPEYMDKPVASTMVTMIDGTKEVQDAGSYYFDDEGVMGEDTVIIRDGILASGLSDILSATTLGYHPTGNGRRESYERKAYARMRNTYFKPGKHTLEEMIASVEYGYFLEILIGGMEDPKNWGIQVVAHVGREIKNGQLTGKVVSPVYLTGHVTEVLKSISMVSSDFQMEGGGACGKGHKEVVKTTSGGPYIKVRGRLS